MTARPGALAAAEDCLVRANRWVLIALMGAMAVLVFANVVSRYLLNYSIIWVEELTRYMMVWVGFLGAGLVLRLGAHIAVEAFQDLLPRAAAQALRACIVALLAATFAAMTWLGVRYAAFAWEQETPALNWSTGAIYLAIPIGSALMLAHLVFIARGYIRAREFAKDESFRPEEAVL
ncbi:MAG TPA: TRAP transporter small permease [Burkholderiales bacterium]|nr:TRAP transporter small permease [Burkholderiales bacterium]